MYEQYKPAQNRYDSIRNGVYAVTLAAFLASTVGVNYAYAKEGITKKVADTGKKVESTLLEQDNKGKSKMETMTENLIGGIGKGLIGAIRGVQKAITDTKEWQDGQKILLKYIDPKSRDQAKYAVVKAEVDQIEAKTNKLKKKLAALQAKK